MNNAPKQYTMEDNIKQMVFLLKDMLVELKKFNTYLEEKQSKR